MHQISRRYQILGRVQGVGFRYFVEKSARSLGLKGWVRNRSDGSVEAQAEGSEQAHAAFRRALKEGPPASRVERVDEREAPLEEASDFRIHP